MAVSFGCQIPSRGSYVDPEALRNVAQRAEHLGFDSVWLSITSSFHKA
jgi:alkanesulfonate monooxygenase SsuD/methylene tetrahydromethanopterin reductase-like flavin-dependent oxidoreductase (luciferase family)